MSGIHPCVNGMIAPQLIVYLLRGVLSGGGNFRVGNVRRGFCPWEIMSAWSVMSGGSFVRIGLCPGEFCLAGVMSVRGFAQGGLSGGGLCPVLVSTISMLFRSSENWTRLLELKQCSNSD